MWKTVSGGGGSSGKTGRYYAAESFSPRKIVAQIAVVQLSYYLLGAIIMRILCFLAGIEFTLSMLLNPALLSFGFTSGYIPIVGWFLTTLPTSYIVYGIVQRAKKCLDHVSTIFMLDLLLTWMVFRFPTHWDWWVVRLCNFVMTAMLSEYLCIQREMRPIHLSDDSQFTVDDMQDLEHAMNNDDHDSSNHSSSSVMLLTKHAVGSPPESVDELTLIGSAANSGDSAGEGRSFIKSGSELSLRKSVLSSNLDSVV